MPMYVADLVVQVSLCILNGTSYVQYNVRTGVILLKYSSGNALKKRED